MGVTKRRVARQCRVEATVAAPVTSVWRVIADVTRTGEWSHECHDVVWVGRLSQPAPGVRFRGRNRVGPLRWSRTCEFLAVEPPHRIAWRTVTTPLFVDSTDWTVSLESVPGGTHIVQSYRVTQCPRWWEWIVVRLVPRHMDRTVALAEDLRRLGAVAAADHDFASGLR